MLAMTETMEVVRNNGDTYLVTAVPFIVKDTEGTDEEELRFRPNVSQKIDNTWVLIEYLKSEETTDSALDAGILFVKERGK